MQNVSAELSAAPARRPVHPFLFTLLVLPKGMAYGYVQVTLGYLLARGGVPVGQIAAVVAAGFLPYVLKFLWAPLVDTTLTYKKWYWLSVGSGALVLTGISLLPLNQGSVPLLTLGVFALTFCFTFSSTAAAGLMAYGVPAALQGRAAGFFQMGSIGGNGLGGGWGCCWPSTWPCRAWRAWCSGWWAWPASCRYGPSATSRRPFAPNARWIRTGR